MKVSLVVMSTGKAEGHTIPINLSQFIIGRDPQCHLRPVSALISKRHCAVLVKGEKLLVRDFNSTNGTLVNEKPVKGETELAHGDILKAGPLTFRVVIERITPVNTPTPPPGKNREKLDDDDDIAALLLDSDGTPTPIRDLSEANIPGGTTEMEIPLPVDEDGKPETDNKKKEAKVAKDRANTSAAAAEILREYQQRKRK
jgi:predicted component of type VI protein secretion system